MEVAIYNIKGEDTGRKAVLADEVFAIDANEHAVYLDVKQYLANQRQGTHKHGCKKLDWHNKSKKTKAKV